MHTDESRCFLGSSQLGVVHFEGAQHAVLGTQHSALSTHHTRRGKCVPGKPDSIAILNVAPLLFQGLVVQDRGPYGCESGHVSARASEVVVLVVVVVASCCPSRDRPRCTVRCNQMPAVVPKACMCVCVCIRVYNPSEGGGNREATNPRCCGDDDGDDEDEDEDDDGGG